MLTDKQSNSNLFKQSISSDSVWSTCHSLTAPNRPLGSKGNIRRFSQTLYYFLHRRTSMFQVPSLLCLVPDLPALLLFSPHFSTSKTFSRNATQKYSSHDKRRAGFYEKQILYNVNGLLEEEESCADWKTKPCSPLHSQ